MTEREFEKLVKPDRYQVFLLSCPASMPLSFVRHPWFVVNKKGVVSRYEVIANPDMYSIQNRKGHLCIDSLPPWLGLQIVRTPKYRVYIWQSLLHGVVEGDDDSLAARMAQFIEQSPQTYPYCERYAYTGPNSNTYAQWIVDHFPTSGLRLPWNSFGKSFLMSADARK